MKGGGGGRGLGLNIRWGGVCLFLEREIENWEREGKAGRGYEYTNGKISTIFIEYIPNMFYMIIFHTIRMQKIISELERGIGCKLL